MGTCPLVSDPHLYARWTDTKQPSCENLDPVCTKHVDDLKGASTKAVFDDLCVKLKDHFGDLTIQIGQSEQLGITHDQRPDYSVVCSQDTTSSS